MEISAWELRHLGRVMMQGTELTDGTKVEIREIGENDWKMLLPVEI